MRISKKDIGKVEKSLGKGDRDSISVQILAGQVNV